MLIEASMVTWTKSVLFRRFPWNIAEIEDMRKSSVELLSTLLVYINLFRLILNSATYIHFNQMILAKLNMDTLNIIFIDQNFVQMLPE